ncbi:MAG: hypothetical protein UU47_C0006G0026 [candidate division TM6 bacterium GW2011_GWE2_41_16]|nr:MAG: hypothetical protein UU47_C0006G0026 [candidate division TM6 bacterium GW2011_GWE2_41_16]
MAKKIKKIRKARKVRKARFDTMSIKTKGFKFNRDEANER